MKRITTVLVAMILIGSSYAQGGIRNVEDFTVLKIKNALEVTLTKGDKNTVTITGASKENLGKIKTEVANGVLSIYVKGDMKSDDEIKISVIYKELSGIEQSGASELTSTNTIKTDKFYIKGSGAMEAEIDFEVTELSIDFSGASEIKLTGNANSFTISLSGASELSASALKTKNAKLDISGASEVNINVSEKIEGSLSGASSVHVKGGATTEGLKTSGVSSLTKG